MVKNGHLPPSPSSLPEVPFARGEGAAFGVEVLALEELRSRELDHSIFRAHRIEFHVLVVATGGSGWHMVDFVQHPLRRGTLTHIAPGQVQRYDGESDVAGFLVLFLPEVCALEAPHVRWPPCFSPAGADFELVESLVQLMFGLKARRLSTPPDRIAWQMLGAVLELCDGAVARHLVREGATRSAEFEAFDALLEREFPRRRELAWYARELGYSERTLSRWSRRVAGVSAKTHIDRRVGLEAKRLLVHTDRSVEGIAARLGFSESTNFVKFFKRVEGTTPSAFRRSYAGGR
ncbi:MAG: helix-turn-helix transcriptional regulator [Acidobacteriota bacterium]